MSRSPLLIGVGASLAGIAVALTMAAIAFQPLLVLLALPFALAGYLIWFQGTGRLEARVRRRARRRAGRERHRPGEVSAGEPAGGRTRTRARAQAEPGSDSGGGDGPRWTDRTFRERRRRTRQRAGGPRAGTGDDSGPDPGAGAGGPFGGRGPGGAGARSRDRSRGRGRGGERRSEGPRDDGMSTEEAYRVLGVDPDSDAEAVRSAYRQRVKRVHPDAEDGDEEAFKRVKEAYETLQERAP